MSRTGILISGALAVILLVIAVFVFRGCPAKPVPIVIPDTLPDSTLIQERPTAPHTVIQKITKHQVAPKVTVSRGTPDTSLVRRFAAAVAQADSLRRSYQRLKDSLAQAGEPIPPPPALPSILPSVGGTYTADGTFTLWMSKSDGAIMRTTAKLRPNFAFVAGVDHATEKQPAFYEDRWWLRTGRKVVHCGPVTGVMAVGGYALAPKDEHGSRNRWSSAAIAGVLTVVGCLAG
jgi:hypothetical protein